ncbi:MAG: Arginine-tRNA ligase [candidate division WWE3 bacterium GW2011_GWC1_41_7]|uniref:Arginine--tRNA ligase n=1 Tax=candidate division WWE3 bacterium GW2011_GWC1_41_7 TaxID=1619119 RepID=A0A0G0X8Q5_UNCKA|nr:MAG: Arginine-tRNA ligase [candidate division WWE3 bacterium GW2011_GWC1_41_7]
MDILSLLEEKIKAAVLDLYDVKLEKLTIERPANENHGDYSTNVALELASEVKQKPLEIAKNVSYKLTQYNLTFEKHGKEHKIFERIEAAPPGFINLELSSEWLHYVLYLILGTADNYGVYDKSSYKGKNVIVEYTDPNPFKVFHIGHLMSNSIGESISRLVEFNGANLKRANYQGDVGLHVAKAIWGLIHLMNEDGLEVGNLAGKPLTERIDYLGRGYARGAAFFNDDESAQQEIRQINSIVYVVAQEHMAETGSWKPLVDYKKSLGDVDASGALYTRVKEVYTTGRGWSLEYFETVYKRLGTHFDLYYFESMAGEFGYELVSEWLGKGVFEKSDNAVVFRGDNYGLHTRVFVNSVNLPTYEAKDLGLALLKNRDFPYDISIIITAEEVAEYFKVVLKALSLIDPDLGARTLHIPHGMMKLTSGKMSSRTGDVIAGDLLLNNVRDVVLEKMESQEYRVPQENVKEIADKIAIAALKYSILKQNLGRDIIYDKEKSISLSGDTGPYLQYTYARTCSVLEKSDYSFNPDHFVLEIDKLNAPHHLEEAVLRQLHVFPEDVATASEELAPHVICHYLLHLAQAYNTLYVELPILTAETSLRKKRLYITKSVNQVLKTGLHLLGIATIERM